LETEQVDRSFEAGLLRFQGKYEQAEEMQLQVLRLRGRCWARSILTTPTSMNNLALVLSQQGKYEQAEEMRRRAGYI